MARTFIVTEKPKGPTVGERVIGVLLCIIPLVALIAVLAPTADAARAATLNERKGIYKTSSDYVRSTGACTNQPVACRTIKVASIRVSTKNPLYSRSYAGAPGFLDQGFIVMKRRSGSLRWVVVNKPNTMQECGTRVPVAVCKDLGGVTTAP